MGRINLLARKQGSDKLARERYNECWDGACLPPRSHRRPHTGRKLVCAVLLRETSTAKGY